jgi:hypothetical protein
VPAKAITAITRSRLPKRSTITSADLKARGANVGNATQIRFNLTAVLAAKPVALLNSKELRAWRNGLVKGGLKAAPADRVGRVLKAALNLAATDDPRITNSSAWRIGLMRLPDTETARNVILPDAVVSSIVAAAYTAVDATYGLFIETAAITGARESQLDRLEVADLQFDPLAPRLMMPSSRKGKNRRVDRKPLPIPVSLAVKLRQAAGNRPAEAPLWGTAGPPLSHHRQAAQARAGGDRLRAAP